MSFRWKSLFLAVVMVLMLAAISACANDGNGTVNRNNVDRSNIINPNDDRADMFIPDGERTNIMDQMNIDRNDLDDSPMSDRSNRNRSGLFDDITDDNERVGGPLENMSDRIVDDRFGDAESGHPFDQDDMADRRQGKR